MLDSLNDILHHDRLSPVYRYYPTAFLTTTKSDNDRIQFALRVAETSTHPFRLGAVLVKSGRVLAFGTNVLSSGPLVMEDRFSLHAEKAAIRAAAKSNLNGATLYIGRLTTTGIVGLAKPCIDCLQFCAEHGISQVVFTVDENTNTSFKLQAVPDLVK